jgi:hypothetical protein
MKGGVKSVEGALAEILKLDDNDENINCLFKNSCTWLYRPLLILH